MNLLAVTNGDWFVVRCIGKDAVTRGTNSKYDDQEFWGGLEKARVPRYEALSQGCGGSVALLLWDARKLPYGTQWSADASGMGLTSPFKQDSAQSTCPLLD